MTATAIPGATVAVPSRPHFRVDALVLGLITVVLRLPAFFAARALVFDDGVYASSVLAMRNGQQPFRDVFSSQGPLFLPLAWVGDLLGFRTLDAPRVLTVASGVLLTIAVYSCGRRVTTRGHALLAAGLVTTSGSVLWVTGPLNADGPSLALSVLAIALALRALDHAEPHLWDAVWVGIACGAAASIKALSVPAIVIAGLVLLLARRRVWDAALAAGVAIAAYVVSVLPWGFDRVLDQSFTYHNDARRLNSHAGAAWKVITTLWERDLVLLVALALALVMFLVTRFTGATRAPQPDGMPRLGIVVALLVLWAVLVFGLLVWEPAVFRAHVAQIVPPLALLASLRPPSWTVLAIAAVVVAPFWAIRNHTILWPHGYSGNQAAVVDRLRALPADALVISDDPGLSWRAGRAPPGNFADPSFLRIQQGRITEGILAKAAASPDVCAVVVSSPQHFGTFHDLGPRLVAEGYRSKDFGDITVFEREDCRA